MLAPIPTMRNSGAPDPQWVPLAELADPFVEDNQLQHRQRPASHSSASVGDQSMPDYKSFVSASSRNHSSHDDGSNALPDTAESQFDELMAAYSPQKETSGTHAPAITRDSSAANTPPKALRPSAAAEARAASYSHVNARSVSVTTRDPQQPPPRVRDSSNMSMKSAVSAQLSEHPVKARPASEIKSRKEGRSGDDAGVPIKSQQQKKSSSMQLLKSEDKGNGKAGGGCDGKRKRLMGTPQGVMVENLLSSSPDRKVTRVEGKGWKGKGEGIVERMVLGERENVG